MEVPKSPRLGVSQLCETITSCVDLQLGQGLNQSCTPRQDLFNDVLHARESGRFPIFCGRESNCQFDSRPFFWP
jgi:hypothetical protein